MITKSIILEFLLLIILSSFCCKSVAQSNQLQDNNFYFAGMKMSLLFQGENEKTFSHSTFDTLYSFPAPGTWPGGLAWDGQYFWNCDADTLMIFKLTMTGNVVTSFPLPNNAMLGGDLVWDGNYLWLADEQAALLFKIDAATGTVMEQFNLPSFGQSDPNGFGLAWDGQYLWHSEYSDSAMIYKLDPQNGQVVSSFVPPKSSILGITWANDFLYGISIEIPLSGGFLYKFEPSSGVVLDSAFWEVPYPLGLVWDGQNFWNVSGNEVGGGNNRIYQVSNPITLIEDDFLNKSNSFVLYQAYPNPFNPSTKIRYSVPQSSNVIIKVFDILGNEIETLVNEERPLGSYEVEFDGVGLTSGVYFYQLRAGNYIETKKIVYIK